MNGCEGGFNVAKKSIEILLSRTYPKYRVLGEPQMSKRGLYHTVSTKKFKKIHRGYMNFLQYADGTNSLEGISKLIKLELSTVKKINEILLQKKLISN